LGTVMVIAETLAKRFAPDAVKMACVVTSDGGLRQSSISSRLSGRAFEYCARIFGFYKEIASNSGRWECDHEADQPVEPSGEKSYLLLSEFAVRYAANHGFKIDGSFEKLPGEYSPRVSGTMSEVVFLKVF